MKVQVHRDYLEKAIAHQLCVDGHRCVFGIAKRPEVDLITFVPPFVQATYQNASPKTSEAIRHFELLSLAARAELEPTSAARTNVLKGVHKTFLQAPARDRCFPDVDVLDLHAVIAEAAARIEALDQKDPRRKLLSRRGLQIRGCRIGKPDEWLNLSHAKLPFSLRFIGCVIEANLELDGCELATLELSGSVVRGLDATLLRANSSVRLRRTFARAPLDFGGARVGGYFDATDCLILPFEPMPTRQSFASDRGALNLSQATIQNEVYLNRARIWGGLSMKGAVFERSLFMHDAIVGAPVAILETLVGKCDRAKGVAARLNTLANDHPGPQEQIDLDRVDELLQGAGWEDQLDELVHQDHHIARRIHGKRANKLRNLECVISYTDRRVDEILRGFKRGKNDTVLYQLLVESRRARTSSIRADGLHVGGSLYAAKLNASGRVRLRYATINGGLHLQGSWLRCIDAIGDNLNYWDYLEGDPKSKAKRLLKLRVATFGLVRMAEKPKDDHHALDLRETHIKGSVTLHAYIEAHPDKVERVPVRARLNGSITARRAVINGEFYASMVHDVTPRAHQRLQPPKERFEGHKKAGLDAATYAERKKKDRARRSDEKFTFQLEHSKIDGDVSFTDSLKVHGVNLLNATINGDVNFSRRYFLGTGSVDENGEPNLAAKLDHSPVVVIKDRARNVRYMINLRSATIEGDAYLPFYSPRLVRARADADGVPADRQPDEEEHGVVIKGEEVTVKGRLDIYPGLAVKSRRPGDDAPIRADNETLGETLEYFDLDAFKAACNRAAATRQEIERVEWKTSATH